MTTVLNPKSQEGFLSSQVDASIAKDLMKKKSRADQISDSRLAVVQGCCTLVETVLYQNLEIDTNPNSHPIGDTHNKDNEPRFVARMRQRHEHVTRSREQIASDKFLIDWDGLPPSLHPTGGELEGNRAGNKRQQVQALMNAILPMVDAIFATNGIDPIHVVDIGAGSGHVGLVVAWMRPTSCRVTLLERKEYACRQAKRRALEAGLANVEIANTTLHTFCDLKICNEDNLSSEIGPDAIPFQLAISLHSCGVLTDAALEMCLHHRAAFCLCPCCYGQTASNDALRPYMPRSLALRSVRNADMPEEWNTMKRGKKKLFKGNEKPKPFNLVARSADCTSAVDGDESFVNTRNFAIAKRCMQIVDADRICWMTEHGYSGEVASILPLEVSPKNNLITGIPREMLTDGFDAFCNAVNSDDPNLALSASALENRNAEAGEKKLERLRIKGAQEKWKEQFQTSLR